MLTTRELSDLRADVLETLISTCTVQRVTTTNNKGKVSETWTAVETDIVCRVDPYQRQDSAGVVADQEQGRAWFRLTLPWDADIGDGDRVIYGGETYELVQLHATHSGHIVTRAIIAKLG